MSTKITEYSATEAVLADLAGRYKGVVWDVTVPAQMTDARKARAEIKGYRVSLEKKRVEIKGPALERCRLIDAEAKRITFELSALEDPIDSQIRAEENRKEAERLAAEKAEADRIAAEEAALKKAEEDRMAGERAEIARRQAELDKAERESRERIETEQREARRKIEEEERAARLKQEEADRAARVAREAEEARLKQERDRLDAEARAVEAEKRKVREAEEARVREEQRKEAEVLDARALLKTFRERFGHIAEFAGVVKEIEVLLKRGKK